MSAQDLHSFGMIEGIIQEGSSNAQLMRNVARTLRDQLAELSAEPSIEVMLEKRYEKFRKIGVFRTINQDQNEGPEPQCLKRYAKSSLTSSTLMLPP